MKNPIEIQQGMEIFKQGMGISLWKMWNMTMQIFNIQKGAIENPWGMDIFFGVRVAYLLLLLCVCDCGCFMFFVMCVCFPCLVFVPGVHSVDYRYSLGSLDYSLNKKSRFLCRKLGIGKCKYSIQKRAKGIILGNEIVSVGIRDNMN